MPERASATSAQFKSFMIRFFRRARASEGGLPAYAASESSDEKGSGPREAVPGELLIPHRIPAPQTEGPRQPWPPGPYLQREPCEFAFFTWLPKRYPVRTLYLASRTLRTRDLPPAESLAK